MRRNDDEIRKSDAERLLIKAKEMETQVHKIPVRINRNTILLVPANKIRSQELIVDDGKHLSKKKSNGRRKF